MGLENLNLGKPFKLGYTNFLNLLPLVVVSMGSLNLAMVESMAEVAFECSSVFVL